MTTYRTRGLFAPTAHEYEQLPMEELSMKTLPHDYRATLIHDVTGQELEDQTLLAGTPYTIETVTTMRAFVPEPITFAIITAYDQQGHPYWYHVHDWDGGDD
jgi:hypothetical protein